MQHHKYDFWKPAIGEEVTVRFLPDEPTYTEYFDLNGGLVTLYPDGRIVHVMDDSGQSEAGQQVEHMQKLLMHGYSTAWESWCATMTPATRFKNIFGEDTPVWRAPNKHELGFLMHMGRMKALMDSFDTQRMTTLYDADLMKEVTETGRELLKSMLTDEDLKAMGVERVKTEKVPDLPPPLGYTDEEAELLNQAAHMAWEASKHDGCEVCGGQRGGVAGNENIIDGVRMCDYCTADRMDEKLSNMRELKPGPFEGQLRVYYSAYGSGVEQFINGEWRRLGDDGKPLVKFEQVDGPPPEKQQVVIQPKHKASAAPTILPTGPLGPKREA